MDLLIKYGRENGEKFSAGSDEALTFLKRLETVETQLMDKFIRSQLMHQLRTGTCQNRMLQSMYEMNKNIPIDGKPVKYRLITISFDDSKFEPPMIEKIVNDIKTRKWGNSIEYVLEQRSDTQEWYGYHMHGLVLINKRPSEIIRELFSIKSIQAVITGKNMIDVKVIGVDNGVHNYLFGDKKDDTKKKKQIQDKLMWKKFNLTFGRSEPP